LIGITLVNSPIMGSRVIISSKTPFSSKLSKSSSL